MFASLRESLHRTLGRFSVAPIEIIPKEDARVMFAMTRDEWNANVQRAVFAGISSGAGDPGTGLSMLTKTPEGHYVCVLPSYRTKQDSPDFLTVVIGYTDPVPAYLTNAMVKSAVETARTQMSPEYQVQGHLDPVLGGKSITFSIWQTAREGDARSKT